ncbi:MAG: hypothetical protein LBC20_14935, partial [Planctomycetaceae bacterium]|nr:hypothetical protein [Planctomycetaceae bacterium]
TPIDPCTGRTTFVYKLRDATKEPTSTEESPKPAELPYILYSFGPNSKDDNGTLPPSPRPSPGVLEYDFVF